MGKWRVWRPAGIYFAAMLVLTPLLPDIIIFCAHRAGITIGDFVQMLKVVTLSGMGIFLAGCFVSNRLYLRPGSYLALITVCAGAAWLAGRFGSPAEATHLVEYGGLAVVLFKTLRKTRPNRPLIKTYLFAALLTSAAGGLDELYQGILPNRYYDPNDILINVVSGILGLVFWWGMDNRQGTGTDVAAGFSLR